MGFFDDDPFEDIVRNFFGQSPDRQARRREVIRGEEEDRTIDFVESEDLVFIIFELPGYKKEDVFVNVKGNELELIAKKNSGDAIVDYLTGKLREGIKIKKELPKIVNSKKFSHTMRNGILEVKFERRK